MKATVLEEVGNIRYRDFDLQETVGSRDVRIRVARVGICGSDIHYFQHGRIGPFVVKDPMILGHEASGIVTEVGDEVTHLQEGDRVCMEPGIPNPCSRISRMGMYNLDPDVRFWATPPDHGVLRESVVHPADFTFKLPDTVTLDQGAMVEPLAVGMHGAMKARVRPGDLAVVMGAGTIGMVTALAALAAGCGRVIISDVLQPKLDLVSEFGPIVPVNVAKESLVEVVMKESDNWGADIVFEASGSLKAAEGVFDVLAPGGCVVIIGIPGEPLPYDVVKAQIKEARVENVFRYAHVYPRAIALLTSGKIDVTPMITDHFAFADSVKAFEYASHMPASSVKVMVEVSN